MKMNKLPIKSIQDIRSLNPCYDPVTGRDRDGTQVNPGYLPEDWVGTALDILNVQECPALDRLWVVLNEDWLDVWLLRKFSVWCGHRALCYFLMSGRVAKELLGLIDQALSIVDRYTSGLASLDELRTFGLLIRSRYGFVNGTENAEARGLAFFLTWRNSGIAAANASIIAAHALRRLDRSKMAEELDIQISGLVRLINDVYGLAR